VSHILSPTEKQTKTELTWPLCQRYAHKHAQHTYTRGVNGHFPRTPG